MHIRCPPPTRICSRPTYCRQKTSFCANFPNAEFVWDTIGWDNFPLRTVK